MKAINLTLSCFTILILAGCVAPTSAPPPSQTISCKLPTITPLDPKKESQEGGGVEISVVPFPYEAFRKEAKSQREVPQPLFGTLGLAPEVARSARFFEVTTSTQLEPKPKQLAYLLKINNKLNRVFRGAGTVVQFNAGGKLVAVDQRGYAELTQAIVPPRSELQVTVYGPPLSQMADKAIIGIFLYDVVTATDTAGNTTEKQNFEWFFDYSVKVVEDTATTTRQIIRTLPR